ISIASPPLPPRWTAVWGGSSKCSGEGGCVGMWNAIRGMVCRPLWSPGFTLMIILEYLLTATKSVLRYPGKQKVFEAFSHDTRQLIPGELFVAVRGEYDDGHDYLLDAVRRGANGLLVEARVITSLASEVQATLEHAGVATIVVEDTRIALQQYASAILA